MTDEQAVREWLNYRSFPLSREQADRTLALLDAKDAEIARLEAENSTLAAGSCDVPDGKIGDEHGHFYCAIVRERDEALSRAEQAEAALAEERKAHQVFREEVSEACHNARYYAGDGEFLNIPEVKRILERFILPAKPADPLVAILEEVNKADLSCAEDAAIKLRAAIERAGGTINFERNG